MQTTLSHTPQVSVIMPTYDRGSVILGAIDSVLRQTRADFELIIVDDGSTDNTKELVDRKDDARLHLLQQTNKGTSAARNLGLKIARGKYIAYLDTDNIWHANFLEVMLSEIGDNVLAYSSRNLLLRDAKNGKTRIIARKVDSTPYNPASLLKGNYIDINSVLHRSDVFQSVDVFDESLTTLEDWDLFTRIAIAFPFKIKHVDQVLCDYYFSTSRTLTTTTNTNFEQDQALAFDQTVDKDTAALRQKFKQLADNNSP